MRLLRAESLLISRSFFFIAVDLSRFWPRGRYLIPTFCFLEAPVRAIIRYFLRAFFGLRLFCVCVFMGAKGAPFFSFVGLAVAGAK